MGAVIFCFLKAPSQPKICVCPFGNLSTGEATRMRMRMRMMNTLIVNNSCSFPYFGLPGIEVIFFLNRYAESRFHDVASIGFLKYCYDLGAVL